MWVSYPFVPDGVTARERKPWLATIALRTDADHAVVELVADQRVAVFEPHRPGRQRSGNALRIGVGDILPDDVVVGVHFDGAGVAGVRQQRVPVFEAAGERDDISRAASGECFDNFVALRDLNRPVIPVRNQDVAIFQQFGGIRAGELVGIIRI